MFINYSLAEGCFPSIFKNAHVRPLLKKPSLPPEDLNNYRPISNLNFISKILEKVVASRMNSHLSTNSLFLSFQSAYRSFHSTESTLLKIHNDIISSIDNGEVTALILLDLSAAFDTVDHSILLSRLKNWFGFEDSCLSWFSSYLNMRKQAAPKHIISSYSTSSCGVPQDPFSARIFSLFTRLLLAQLYPGILWIIICMLMTLNCTFRSNRLVFTNLRKLFLQPTVTLFLGHTTTNSCSTHLKLNCFWLYFTAEEEAFRCHSIISRQYHYSSKHIGSELGFHLRFRYSLTSQVNLVCKSSHFHIRDIRRIRNLILYPLQSPWLTLWCQAGLIIVIHYFLAWASRTSRNSSVYDKFSCAGHHTNFLYQHITPVLRSKIFTGSLSLNGLSI